MEIQGNTSAQGLGPYLLHATQIFFTRQHLKVFINFSITPTILRPTTLQELRKCLDQSDNIPILQRIKKYTRLKFLYSH